MIYARCLLYNFFKEIFSLKKKQNHFYCKFFFEKRLEYFMVVQFRSLLVRVMFNNCR